MTEQMLLRLAMVLQDQAPSTLDKYICKLAASVLLEYPDGLSVQKVKTEINRQFNLSFTEGEVFTALQRKGKPRIVMESGVWVLSARASIALSQNSSFSESLKSAIERFATDKQTDIDKDNLYFLLLKYLYHCFNSNVDNLLSLFDAKGISTEKAVFEASNEDVLAINSFIAWDDSEKNSLIYHIVATCYEYCMLTIKKDNILSKELFKGKRFFLDANIIFRMAGINNEERKLVTVEFTKACRDAGIELICTSQTVDEVYHVIKSQIGYIRSIAGMEKPVSCDILERLNPTLEVNDFYRQYYEWCQRPDCKYGDYASFQQYLNGLVKDAITSLSVVQSGVYKVGKKAQDFEDQVKSLIDFKNERRKWRYTTQNSAETDVNNINDIIMARKGEGNSLWQTNDFMVSADHRLIEWANEVYSGVPLVVLPSVWLAIILRYTGRTDDDYKSFCLFLTQRQHGTMEGVVDSTLLLRKLNQRTSRAELKEQIITEILQNKDQYGFNDDEDYDLSIDRAFDRVMEDKTDAEVSAIREELEKKHSDEMKAMNDTVTENAERHKAEIIEERDKTVLFFAKEKAADKVRPFKWIQKISWLPYVIGGLILILAIFIWMYEWQPIYGFIYDKMPAKVTESVDVFGIVWAVISTGFGLIVVGLGKLVSYLGSNNRESKLSKLYYEEGIKRINSSKVLN